MKYYLYQILLFLFGLLLSAKTLVAEELPSLKLAIDTPAIRIGEQTTAYLSLSGKGGIPNIAWPVFYDTLAPGIEIIDQSGPDTLIDRKDDRYSLTKSYLITSWDSGYYTLNRISIRIIQDQDTLRITAPQASLRVFTPTVGTEEDIMDIAGPLPFPLRFRDILPYILGTLALIILTVLMLYFGRKRKNGESILGVFSKPPVPPHIRALEELETLRKKKLWQEGKAKAYHSELNEILRTYLEGRFDIRALEMVSTEILEALYALPALSPHLAALKDAMELADMVKFAKHLPLPDENEKCFREIRDFVSATRPLSEIQEERQAQTTENKTKAGAQ